MSTTDREEPDRGVRHLDAGRPAGPLTARPSAQLQAVHDELDLAVASGGPVPEQLMDHYSTAIVREYVSERHSPKWLWPDSLYIPAQADFRRYWILPPPDSRRYCYEWAGQTGGGPTPCQASAADGRLFSWVNVSALNPGYIGWAGTGVRFAPTAQRSLVTVGCTVDLVAEKRWWYLPGPSAGYANIKYRGTVYVAVWQISPADGSWVPVRPFGYRTVLDVTESGLGGSAVQSTHHALADVGATVEVQGGSAYGVGVAFEVEILPTFLDRFNKQYEKQPGDDIKLWASMAGTAESITVSTTKILVP